MTPSIRYASVVLTVSLITFAASFPPHLISDESNLEELTAVDQSDWPREIVTNRGVVVIYQPQLEKFEGNTLSARAAFGIERDNEETVFGAVWFDARLETDREDRFALITDLDVTDVRFPNQTDEQVKNFSGLLESEIPEWNLPIEMDEPIAAMEVVETQEASDRSACHFVLRRTCRTHHH